MTKIKHYSISFLSINALSNVNASIYSISAPKGIPLAILVTFTLRPSNIFFMYKLVVSPSMVGFTAIIISSNCDFWILEINFSIPISSGFIPSNGDIKLFKTWYKAIKTN